MSFGDDKVSDEISEEDFDMDDESGSDSDGDSSEETEEASDSKKNLLKLTKGKNYITPAGLEKLKSEYRELFQVERPKLVETIAWAASNGDRSENADYIYGKRRLREVDRRLGFLSSRLEKAVIVDISLSPVDQVSFGATVLLEDEDEKTYTYQVVGEDESLPEQGKISWTSPLAQALLSKKIGDEVVVQRPAGEKVYFIKKISYIK